MKKFICLASFLLCGLFSSEAFANRAVPCPSPSILDGFALAFIAVLILIFPVMIKYFLLKKFLTHLEGVPKKFGLTFTIVNLVSYVPSFSGIALGWTLMAPVPVCILLWAGGILAITAIEKKYYDRKLGLEKYGKVGWGIVLKAAVAGWGASALLAGASIGVMTSGECASTGMYSIILFLIVSVFLVCRLWCSKAIF